MVGGDDENLLSFSWSTPGQDRLRIYVASSWRNKYQPDVVVILRRSGYDVYDFRNPAPDDDGFRWSDIDPNWKISWDVEKYAKALEHPIAKKGFKSDMDALQAAHLCVLVLPSGRSASWEYGYHNGYYQQSGIVFIPEEVEPELMYSGSIFVAKMDELPAAVERWRKLHDM